jgi:hypothetical protein
MKVPRHFGGHDHPAPRDPQDEGILVAIGPEEHGQGLARIRAVAEQHPVLESSFNVTPHRSLLPGPGRQPAAAKDGKRPSGPLAFCG